VNLPRRRLGCAAENGKSRKLEGVKLDGRKYKLGPIEGEAAGRGATLGLTPIQVDAILELQLHRLTKLSIDEISNELKQVREAIAEFQSILGSEKKLRGVIVKELEEVKKLYGDERRTKIEDEAALDGLYVVRTSVPAASLSADEAVATYKSLAHVERATIVIETANNIVHFPQGIIIGRNNGADVAKPWLQKPGTDRHKTGWPYYCWGSNQAYQRPQERAAFHFSHSQA